MKLCTACGGSFAGGGFCPDCGPRQPLTDMATPEARALVDANDDMRLAVMAHFAERRGMVRSVFMFLVGVAAGAMTLRMAFGADTVAGRVGWVVAAVLVFGSCTWAGMRAQNHGTDFYECVDESRGLKYVPTRKGFGWTTW